MEDYNKLTMEEMIKKIVGAINSFDKPALIEVHNQIFVKKCTLEKDGIFYIEKQTRG